MPDTEEKRPAEGAAEEPDAKLPAAAKDEEGLRVTNRVPTEKHMMFGASGLGCLYADVSPEQATAVFDAVVKAGITYVDTAPWYGAGLSESRTGEYFKDKTGFTFSTKCGRIIKPVAEADKTKEAVETGYSGSFITDKYHKNIPVATYTAEGIRESFKQSCERMQMTSFQSLRLHDAENPERWAEATDGGGVEAMVALRAEGKIKEVSMGMNSSEYLLKYLRKYPAGTFDSIMMAGCFNLIDQDGVELLLECQKLGVKVTNVGIFASGALWGSTHYKYEGIPPAIVEKIKKWKELSEKYGLTLPQVALNFAVMPDVVEMVAFGCKKVEQVKTNMDLCGKAVPLDLWKEAKASGLIAENVPIPSA